MELFVKVVFWILVAEFIIRAITMGAITWPRQKVESLGAYVGVTILYLAMMIWAGLVLWK